MCRRALIAIVSLVISSVGALACGTGGSQARLDGVQSCDEAYTDSLRRIDARRTEAIRRQRAIEDEQHQAELARLRRQQELSNAKATVNPPGGNIQTGSRAGSPEPECRAFPNMCASWK